MTKAIFLDRDGVINDGTLYYTYKQEDFIFNDGIFEGLRMLRDVGFIFIVITNQAGVAKGLYTAEDVENLHVYMCDEFRKQGIEIAKVYYCPHYPEISGHCECRKPGTKMIDDAVAEFSIDKSKSFLIGDGSRDIEAAERAGIVGFKIDKNASIVPVCQEILSLCK